MLFIIFDFDELLTQPQECTAFARLAISNLNAIILVHDENRTSIALDKMFNAGSSCAIVEESLESFLASSKNDRDNWYLIVTNKKINIPSHVRHFASCPYQFWGNLDQFKKVSFTEHAKKKLIYNELSWLYMDSLVNDTVLEVDFLSKLFKRNHVRSVLDCCCGVGRHAARLGERGFKVTGIDASSEQIFTAMLHNKNDNVDYIVHDARNFSLANRSYDAAICMWTTYNYFSQDSDFSALLSNMWSHLHYGGYLVLDSKNIPILEKNRLYYRNTDRADLKMTLLVYKRVLNMIQNSQYFYFIDCLKAGRHEKLFYLDEEFVRFYTLEEMIKLNNARFNLVNAYGDFHGNVFDSNNSKRMVTVWQKV